MRIVGGRWRGRQIEAPRGRGVTRPTTDRTREQVASMVLSARGLDLTGDSVLDAFAGSGAMGLELLSRGAAHATLTDADRGAVARIRRSAAALGARPDELSALAGDVFALAARGLPGAPFDVVFLDPPYALDAGRVSALVDGLAASGQLSDGAVVVYEHAADAPGLACACLELVRSRRHGISCVDLLTARVERDAS
ncbi:RsmD family RNA methyltransferase [Thermophilibacter mediterraneus]|uniref:RsmD family RNA methyltransferase n=1 Tax=Thermophilibacter mediterraneus TaxID=1871031 RepID=UPI00235761AA|nr:RsmD family RNA methyltransferase [Thermophilibacter mediterraneus]